MAMAAFHGGMPVIQTPLRGLETKKAVKMFATEVDSSVYSREFLESGNLECVAPGPLYS